ncbi:MAG: DUF4810 domain-containing protein [Burkholderiales bacterium]
MSGSRLSRFVGALIAAIAIAGCAQPGPRPLYHWEGFQRQLYEHFKGDGSSPEEQLRVLEALAQKAAGSGTNLPPGFRGHLAMIYLRLGRFDDAKLQLESEKASFPESAAYMDFLLKRMAAPKS